MNKKETWYMVKYSYRPGMNAFFQSWQRAYEYIYSTWEDNGFYMLGDTIYTSGSAEFAKIIEVSLDWSEK